MALLRVWQMSMRTCLSRALRVALMNELALSLIFTADETRNNIVS